MTDDELKELVAANSRAIGRLEGLQEENARLWEQHREKNDRVRGEIRESRVHTDRMITSIEKQLDEIRKELGRIGNTLGGVSEGLCSPAVAHIMRERFHMTQIAYQVEARRNGRSIELDVFAHANDRIHQAYVAEINTTLDQDAFNQLHNELRLFPEFFPHHRGKELYGILAAVNAPAELQEKVLKDGIYLIRASADVFELWEPEGFRPRIFPNP